MMSRRPVINVSPRRRQGFITNLHCTASRISVILAVSLLYEAFKVMKLTSTVVTSIGNDLPTLFSSTTGEQHQTKTAHPATIVIQLVNQLGNNLAGIAAGRGLQLWLNDEYGIDAELVLRHATFSRKLRDTMIEAHQCFPNLRQFNFTQGNTPEYDQNLSRQMALLGEQLADALHVKHPATSEFEKSLSTLNMVRQWKNLTTNLTENGYKPYSFNIPFLLVDVFARFDVLVDKYYDDFRRWFEFDVEACCKLKPDPDESVFHFRNFLTEMPRRGKQKGFEELSANRTAYELFRNLRPGDKVAITSRFSTHPSVQPYVDALTHRGIQVRVITGQTGVEDFCFLLHAQKELVGIAESTYVAWAAHLGNAKVVRFYSMDSPSRRLSPSADRIFFHYNWTHPMLRKKELFELYAEEN